MSNIYLVRHGQAGTRDAYDSLSELGREQARRLGEYFIAQGLRFNAAYTGGMCRQRQTAEQVRLAYAVAARPFPDLRSDEAWNEFDLGRVYQEIGPQLAAGDADFRRQYAEVCEQARRLAGSPEAPVHRKWQPCDTAMVDAWIAGRFPYTGESWRQFCERVTACRRTVQAAEGNVLVFTSAVPVGIWAGLSLDIADRRVMQLAGVLYNTSYTIVRCSAGDLRLFAFNAIPHLDAPELRTHR